MCNDSLWGLTDALVACRQLGLPINGATIRTVSAVPEGTRVGWLRNVRCTGTESSLFDCNVQPSKINCHSFGYAGVSCQGSKS